jgi:hypothetical protein
MRLPKPAGCDPRALVSKPSVKNPVPDPIPASVEGVPLDPLAKELAVPADPVPELEAALVALAEPEAPLVAAEAPPDPVLPVTAPEMLPPVVLAAPFEPPPFDGVEGVLLHAKKHVAAAMQERAKQRVMTSPGK